MADGGNRDWFITLLVALIAGIVKLAEPFVAAFVERRKAKRDRRHKHRTTPSRRKTD